MLALVPVGVTFGQSRTGQHCPCTVFRRQAGGIWE